VCLLLKYVERVPGMPLIDISDTAITKRGAERLKRMLPDSQIDF
jgi:hypothetical protein